MNAQPDMFLDYIAPHIRDSQTSLAAAEAIKPSAAFLREKVRAHIQSCGSHGSTDNEGIEATGIPGSTYRPRRCELEADGIVFDSALRRKSASGRNCVVWRASGERMRRDRARPAISTFGSKNEPVPSGAKLISQFEGYSHGRYSVLIEWEAESPKPEAQP